MTFSPSSIDSYKQRVTELKGKMKKRKGDQVDAKKRPVYEKRMLKVSVSLKCKEGGKFKLKQGKTWSTEFDRNCNYQTVHNLIRI